MLVVTHHGEEDTGPLAIVDNMDQVVDIIKGHVDNWACPPIEDEMSIRVDTDYPSEHGVLFRVYEEEYVYDDWNAYVVREVPYIKG